MNSSTALLLSLLALLASSTYAQIVPGEYIVELNGGCTSACRGELSRALVAAGLQTCKVTDRVATIKTKSFGFISCSDHGRSARDISQGLVQEADSTLAAVIRVDADMVVRKIQRSKPCRGKRCPTEPTDPPAPSDPPTSGPETPALLTTLWGVDQVDGTVNNERCPLSSSVGDGVDAYIMDTGCTPDTGALCTSEFRVKGKGSSPCRDDDGHGTHVAGTTTSGTYGVAPKATLHCLKVLTSQGGSVSGIINGISRVVRHHDAAGGRKGVVNMSLGGGFSQSFNDAVIAASGDGLYFTLAAGNEAVDACTTSPASATVGDDEFIYSVAAHDKNGVAASFTNFGTCSDLSAPGVEIMSTNEVVYSGTSMAAPHVAGAIAVVLSDGGAVNLGSITGASIIPGINKPVLEISC